MTSYRYDTSSLAADYARSGAGFAVAGGLLIAVDPLPAIGVVLAAATALFLAYGLRTGLRHVTEIEVDAQGIRTRGPLGGVFDRSVSWDTLKDMKLSYFSTQRDRKSGWMQLRVRGDGGVVRCDSGVEDFAHIVEYACRAARARQIGLDPTTVANLKSIGLAHDVEPPL
jgi:hypothetical protein